MDCRTDPPARRQSDDQIYSARQFLESHDLRVPFLSLGLFPVLPLGFAFRCCGPALAISRMKRSKRGHASGFIHVLGASGFSHGKIAERISGSAVYKLPRLIGREIGRIIVDFAYFEQCVQEMVWMRSRLVRLRAGLQFASRE